MLVPAFARRFRFAKLAASLSARPLAIGIQPRSIMPPRILLLSGCLVVLCGSPVRARSYCPGPGQTLCTGACSCSNDSLRLSFLDTDTGLLVIDAFVPNLPIDVSVTLDTHTDLLTEYGFGLTHDAKYLELETVSIEGTDVAEWPGPCHLFHWVRTDGGTVFAHLLTRLLCQNIFLDSGRDNVLLRLRYRLIDDPGVRGTAIRFSGELRTSNESPLVPIVVNTSRKVFSPSNVHDGLVRRREISFRRADADQNGEIEVADSIALLMYLFRGDTSPTCLASLDVDGNNALEMADAVRILTNMFFGQEIPEPFAACGEEAKSRLPCESFAPCN